MRRVESGCASCCSAQGIKPRRSGRRGRPRISWRTGTKGKLKARFAAIRVRIADGPPQRIRDKGQQHLPGEEAWLIGEHRMSGEKKFYLANLPAKTDLRPGTEHLN